MRFTRARPVS